MYYPELLNICNKSVSEELIKEIDKWMAFLPANQQDKITISKVCSVFNIDYMIAKFLMERIAETGVIKQIFAILCPNCGLVLKITDEDNYVEDFCSIKSRDFCYGCKENIGTLAFEDVEIRYKLEKKPTGDLEFIKEDSKKSLGVAKEEDKIKKLIEEGYNANNLFYKPAEIDYGSLEALLCGVDESIASKNITTTEKGDRLEDLVLALMNSIKGCTATKNITTEINQIDCLVRSQIGVLSFPHILNEMGSKFYCECKNEKKHPDNNYFHKLGSIMAFSQGITRDRRFGIIFSRENATKTIVPYQKSLFQSRNIILISFTLEELRYIIKNKTNFLDNIEEKVSKIILDANEDLKDIGLY